MSEAAVNFVKYLGFDLTDETTADDLQKWGSENLINVKDAGDHKVVRDLIGKRLGSNQTAAKKTFKDAGVVFPDGKADRWEDVMESGVQYFQNQITELTGKLEAASKGNPDQTKEFEAKIAEIHDLKKNLQDLTNINTQLKGTIEEKDGLIAGAQKEKESFIFNQLRNDAHAKLGLDPNANKLQVKGFFAEMNETYKTSLKKTTDDEGKVSYGLEIRGLDGELVSDPKKHGESLSYTDVYKQGAATHKILKINDDGGKPASSGLGNFKPERKPADNNGQSKSNKPIATGGGFKYRNSGR